VSSLSLVLLLLLHYKQLLSRRIPALPVNESVSAAIKSPKSIAFPVVAIVYIINNLVLRCSMDQMISTTNTPLVGQLHFHEVSTKAVQVSKFAALPVDAIVANSIYVHPTSIQCQIGAIALYPPAKIALVLSDAPEPVSWSINLNHQNQRYCPLKKLLHMNIMNIGSTPGLLPPHHKPLVELADPPEHVPVVVKISKIISTYL
jgi:hypothetical protein